ncbi:hydroxylamine oxidase [Dissulfurirhabdus thermomarina]|uniref:Hydroxylamine oxidase n=1 Tax=Dissulfurirhabdus thermomarina TaxID=1765737 RepID=A0A6N9TR75_DISTH|nr:multiheme c-type cytochrome [Dissulfurirhabdus thermomarina]NDY41947.1 hydroxylamine oxidase [Dissulfurirhabdus thermomarina]NMX22931.1 hydroxylamine oxidase [Dissulfurirhabdus thermomarina]
MRPRFHTARGWTALAAAALVAVIPAAGAAAAAPEVSEATEECLSCHAVATPGIVADWKASRHAATTPMAALERPALERRVSADQVPPGLRMTVVGCAECHTANPDAHADTFDHNGYRVHVVVTPADCAACHPEERAQYDQNIMSHAYGNLHANPVYHNLVETTDGVQVVTEEGTRLESPDDLTLADSCFSCHGTEVKVAGTRTVETDLGEMDFPILTGWPNQGVGRVNPDGTLGACTSCHPRHGFSIEVARKPYTCGQCHKGPDVPAYKVYQVSKHGNLFASVGKEWNFSAVPWVVGRDFTAPTCATCHASLVVTDEGEVVARRSHRMNDRIGWRIFGLVYAHAHPKSPDTTVIRNRAGLPLPTELTGEPAAAFLIDKDEQARRRAAMQAVCRACHSRGWVEGHYARFDRAIETTNAMTLAATRILLRAWDEGAAKGLEQKDSIFNEAIEKMWVEQWLFYGNSVRFAAAMGGADYGVFANGRWVQAKNLQAMKDWLDFKLKKHKGGWLW